MSDSNWSERAKALGNRVFLAAGVFVLLFMVGAIFFLEGKQSEARETRTYEYEQAAKANAVVRCQSTDPAAVADCVYDEIGSARQQAQSEQDLDAQQWMARWAMILTAITAITTLISCIALRYLRDTFKKTAEAAEAAAGANKAMVRQNELTENSQRPWINIKLKNWSPISLANDRLTGEVFFEIENVGQTPANRVQIFDKVSADTYDRGTAMPFFEEKAVEHGTGEWGDILPPNGNITHKIEFDINVNDSIVLNREDVNFLLPSILIIATYCSVGSSKPLQTGFCFVVGMHRGGQVFAFFNEPGVYNQSSAVIVQHPGASIIT